MRTLDQLSHLGTDGLPRLRGLLLIRLLQAGRGHGNDGLLHLFLLPPQPPETRLAIHETAHPFDGDVPLQEATAAAAAALQAAGGDPRHLPDGDLCWAKIDPHAQALYLGTGWRFASPNPQVPTTTIVRLVDATALYLCVGVDEEPLPVQASKPYRLGDQLRPPDTIDAVDEGPFQLVDALVQLLR